MKAKLNLNGPIMLETGGKFTYRHGEVVETVEKPRVFLCRCGQSANKPFCDGAHKTVGFEAPAGEIEFEQGGSNPVT